MAWPWLAIIAKNVPWAELVRRAPDIIDRSRKLLKESTRQQPDVRTDAGSADLTRRLDALEARDAEHARIIAPMGDQLSDLTDVVQVLQARSKFLGVVVVVLALAQIVMLVIALR